MTIRDQDAQEIIRRLESLANTIDAVRYGASLDGVDNSRLYDAARGARATAESLAFLLDNNQQPTASV